MEGHLQERGPKTWRLSVYVGRDQRNGRKRYVQRTVHGTEREAQRALARLVTEVDDGRHAAAGAESVDALLDRWLAMKASAVERTTLASYRWVADKYIRPAIGHRRLSSLKPADLDAFYARLAHSGGKDGSELSPRTVRICHGVMRQALEQARRWGLIARNPAVDATPPRSRHHEIRPPSVEQVVILLAEAQRRDEAFGTYLRVLAATGCRRGEALALRWTDVEWATSELKISRSLAVVGSELVEKDTKTHQVRRVSVDQGTLSELRHQRDSAAATAHECGIDLPAGGHIFSSDAAGAQPWRPDVTTHRFRMLCSELGLDGVRLHDLRHYVATMLSAAGTPLATVSARLGHRDKATTLNIYQHAVPAQDQQAAILLGSLLDSAAPRLLEKGGDLQV